MRGVRPGVEWRLYVLAADCSAYFHRLSNKRLCRRLTQSSATRIVFVALFINQRSASRRLWLSNLRHRTFSHLCLSESLNFFFCFYFSFSDRWYKYVSYLSSFAFNVGINRAGRKRTWVLEVFRDILSRMGRRDTCRLYKFFEGITSSSWNHFTSHGAWIFNCKSLLLLIMTHEGRQISNAHIEISRKRETLCESQKTVKRILPEDGIVLSFFRRGEEVCLYSMLSRFSSGSKWWIHDSSQ